MDNKNIKVLELKDADGNDVKVLVKRPTPQQISKATIETMHVFSEAIQQKAMPREAINEYMEKNGFWTEEKDAELKELNKKISDAQRQFRRGGKTASGEKFSKEDGFKLAVETRRNRNKLSALLSKQNELDDFSIQSQIENAKIQYLVFSCCYLADKTDSKGQPVRLFNNYDEFLQQQNDEIVVKSTSALMEILYGFNPDYYKDFLENKFLVEHGFAREEDCALINKDGHLVDEAGRLIDETGRYIRYNGDSIEFTDIDGNLVDEDGNPIEEFTPFED